jgi:hypothetical protein
MNNVNMHVQRDFDYPSDRVWAVLGNFSDILVHGHRARRTLGGSGAKTTRPPRFNTSR